MHPVALLQQQADRDIEQRRRAQAAQVFLELHRVGTKTATDANQPEGAPLPALVVARAHNTSGLPVYKLAVIWANWGERGVDRYPTGSLVPAKDLEPLAARLMPGETIASRKRPQDPSPYPWLVFRDAAGVEWRTDTDGHLIEQAKGQFIEQAENALRARWHGFRRYVAALTGKANSL